MHDSIKTWLRRYLSGKYPPPRSEEVCNKIVNGQVGGWNNLTEMADAIEDACGIRPDEKELQDFLSRFVAARPASPVIGLTASDIQVNTNLPVLDNRIAWDTYKTLLLEEAGFSNESVLETEQAASWIVNRLNFGDNAEDISPRRGLVFGSVQSGKTANMGAVISMAADCGINVIIVFAGMYNSLKAQTAGRFADVLRPTASVQWEVLDLNENPAALSQMDLRPQSPKRYIVVLIKQSSRMGALLNNINELRNQKKQMKVLVLDDEADQASVTTNEPELEPRTAINKKLVELIFNLQPNTTTPAAVSFGAMNYLAYTATPYANILNEAGARSLYPGSFIIPLQEPKQYFGIKAVFGNPDLSAPGLDIIREVSDSEVDAITDCTRSSKIPAFKDAVRWFFCVTAALRTVNWRKPVTMLINTNVKTEQHGIVDSVLEKWLKSEDEQVFLEQCEEIYESETASFTKEDLRDGFPGGYELIDSVPDSFPAFEDIKGEILELKNNICRIEVDANGKYQYGLGVHLCVDNAAINDNYRIRYPDKETLKTLKKAPAFIVVGGLTLSRGLTLEGLTCSYFARKISNADTLMQAARWFGYRKGYELYQRIWMPDAAYEKFRAMSRVDGALKTELRRFQTQNISPAEFGPRIMTFPDVVKLNLAAKNKTHRMIPADMDYTGASFETTEFIDSKDVQIENLTKTGQFLRSLKKPEASEIKNGFVWRNIASEKIVAFLKNFSIPKNSLFKQSEAEMLSWLAAENKEGRLTTWNVAIHDNTRDEYGSFRITENLSVGNAGRSQEIYTSRGTVNIGSLRSGEDVLVDVISGNLNERERQKLQEALKTRKDCTPVRGELLPETPLLLMYPVCGDGSYRPKSPHRKAITLGTTIMGLVIVIPGCRYNKHCVHSVTVQL